MPANENAPIGQTKIRISSPSGEAREVPASRMLIPMMRIRRHVENLNKEPNEVLSWRPLIEVPEEGEARRRYIIEAGPLGVVKDNKFHRGGDTIAIPPKKVEPATEDEIMSIYSSSTEEPEKFVFAGGMIAAGDMLLEKIRHYFNEYNWVIKNEEAVEICFATLGEDAGIIGAAALAKNMISG